MLTKTNTGNLCTRRGARNQVHCNKQNLLQEKKIQNNKLYAKKKNLPISHLAINCYHNKNVHFLTIF